MSPTDLSFTTITILLQQPPKSPTTTMIHYFNTSKSQPPPSTPGTSSQYFNTTTHQPYKFLQLLWLIFFVFQQPSTLQQRWTRRQIYYGKSNNVSQEKIQLSNTNEIQLQTNLLHQLNLQQQPNLPTSSKNNDLQLQCQNSNSPSDDSSRNLLQMMPQRHNKLKLSKNQKTIQSPDKLD